MNIRRVVIGAAIVAVAATPLAAGVASAIPPNGTVVQAHGYGSSPDAARADAQVQLDKEASYVFAYFCYPAYFSDVNQQNGVWHAWGHELCLTD